LLPALRLLNQLRAAKLGEADTPDTTNNAVVNKVEKRIAMLVPRNKWESGRRSCSWIKLKAEGG
jgi:hypothetical protein